MDRNMSMGTTRIGVKRFKSFLVFILLIYEKERVRQGEFVSGFILILPRRAQTSLHPELPSWTSLGGE
jgi:hypothetical protein